MLPNNNQPNLKPELLALYETLLGEGYSAEYLAEYFSNPKVTIRKAREELLIPARSRQIHYKDPKVLHKVETSELPNTSGFGVSYRRV